jgi:hypothetical protein
MLGVGGQRPQQHRVDRAQVLAAEAFPGQADAIEVVEFAVHGAAGMQMQA